MRRLVLYIILLFSVQLTAQDPELGLFFGNTYYIGDLKPYSHFSQQDFVVGGIFFQMKELFLE